MKVRDIEAPGFYEVALDVSGRGGGRVDYSEVVYVTAVERDPWYTDSVQHFASFERMLTGGLRSDKRMTRFVMRRVTHPLEVAKCEAAYEMCKLAATLDGVESPEYRAACERWARAGRAWNEDRERRGQRC